MTVDLLKTYNGALLAGPRGISLGYKNARSKSKQEVVMSISFSSVRRAAVGALGAGAVAGGLLLGAAGTAAAAPVSAPVPSVSPVATAGFHDGPMPQWGIWHHHWFHHWWWWW
jgi:hypothetical protein